jgi:hypothetical protein
MEELLAMARSYLVMEVAKIILCSAPAGYIRKEEALETLTKLLETLTNKGT